MEQKPHCSGIVKRRDTPFGFHAAWRSALSLLLANVLPVGGQHSAVGFLQTQEP